MRALPLLAFLLFLAVPALAQSPEAQLQRADLEAHLRFLAADEMMGRRTGTPWNDVAARYLAEQFRRSGVRTVPGMDSYFQPIPFVHTAPPRETRLSLGGEALDGRLAVLSGGAVDVSGPAVFVGQGATEADYAGHDVAGKVVVAVAGVPGDNGAQAAFSGTASKRRLAAEQGAAALVELYSLALPWRTVAGVVGRPRFALDDGGPILPHLWVEDPDGALATQLQADAGQATLASSGMSRRSVASNNVIGWIEGSDSALRDEVIVLTAHYDHVGAGMDRGPGATPADSIFNGARDNGMGTVALLSAAQALAEQPPKRSVLLVGFTAEEEGLLGSRYFADHPVIPLNRIVYGLNVDAAGFSDTTFVVLVGSGRTTGDALIAEGAGRFGLDVRPDPAPEQNLFDRSDNVSLTRKGIPVPTFTPGFNSFTDPGIATYYHRPSDEADGAFDYNYLLRFAQAFTSAARTLADAPEIPFWTPGDVYEATGRALYGR